MVLLLLLLLLSLSSLLFWTRIERWWRMWIFVVLSAVSDTFDVDNDDFVVLPYFLECLLVWSLNGSGTPMTNNNNHPLHSHDDDDDDKSMMMLKIA